MGKNSTAAKWAATKINKVLGSSGKGGQMALRRVGQEVVNQLKQDLSKGGTGVARKRGGVTHRASKPGAAPAVDTGALRASYQYRVFTAGQNSAYCLVGTNLEYAPFLEFGTSRMAARPHLRPAVEKVIAKAPGIFASEIAKAQSSA